ncbi:MAG: glycosyltransferase [Verrucomicrobiota bacterium]
MRLLFFDNSPVFGGHEVMTLAALEGMAADPDLEIAFLYFDQNQRLKEGLAAINRIETHATPIRSRRFQSFWNMTQQGAVAELASRMRELAPDAVIVAQGDIEISSMGVHAARKAGLRCISYIPCPHTQVEMGAKLGRLRDVCNRSLYNLPDAFITICQSMADRLQERGTRVPIEVVYNGIDLSRLQPRSRSQARNQLGLSQEKQLVGLAGRVQFDQKGQDFFLRSLANWNRPDTELVIAGDGPDLSKLKGIAEAQNLPVHFLAWQNDPVLLYSSLDVLVMPSRFEGFPLVMIEAIQCGIPVLASDRDGMQEFLPPNWRFNRTDPNHFRMQLETLLDSDPQPLLKPLQEQIQRGMTREAFGSSFRKACKKLVRMETTRPSPTSRQVIILG